MQFITDIDLSILLWIQENVRHEFLTPFARAITRLGDLGLFWILLGLILLMFKKTRPIGYAALLSLVIGALINNVALKNLVARTRPYDFTSAVIPVARRPHDYSFPSGHTCASFSSAFIYYRMCPRKYGVPLMVLAVLIGLSRLYVGVHYPTDVIGGVLVAFLASILTMKVIAWQKRTHRMSKFIEP